MYTMKQTCQKVGMSYETLKFYCKQGLVPNVKRNEQNYRIFDDRDLAWIQGLLCLRKCGLSLQDMKQYMEYCFQGSSTIPQRIQMLEETRHSLLAKAQEIEESLCFINQKRTFYDDVLTGKTPYISNLISTSNKKEDLSE